MVYCAVVGCRNNNNKRSKNYSSCYRYFCFPTAKEISNLWVQKCYRYPKNSFNLKTARICSMHFSDDDYRAKEKLLQLPKNKWKLKDDAVPSRNLAEDSPKIETSKQGNLDEGVKKGDLVIHQTTVKMGCKANVKLRVCPSGQYLVVQSKNLHHTGHEFSEAVFDQLPSRSVPAHMALGADKSNIQDKIPTDSGKKTSSKEPDISSKEVISPDDLEEAISLLRDQFDCNVHVLADEEDQFKALLFNTENMRSAMEAWPEFVSIDATIKLTNIGCTLFLCLVEDSNGQSEIVFVSLIADEDRDTYRWLFETFKTEFETDGIRCFMGYKDYIERDVIKEVFPDKPFYIFLFHTLKTLKREINCEKLSISKEERDLSLDYLQKLVYCENEGDYNLIYDEFEASVPEIVFEYFNENWHDIREEWRVFEMSAGNVKNTTNNRTYNKKIKTVMSNTNSVIDVIKGFFLFLESQYQERNNNAAKYILKKSLKRFEKHEKDMEQYRNLLTDYAFTYIEFQVNSIPKVDIVKEFHNNKCLIRSSQGNMFVSIEHCQCRDFASMMLPCKHLLAVRNAKKLALFVPNLCHIRWTKSYYLSKQRIGQHHAESEPTSSSNQRIMTLAEKRKAATSVTNSLVQLLTVSNDSDFNYKMDMLKIIEQCWKSGKEVSINILNDPIEIKEDDIFYNSESNETNDSCTDEISNKDYQEIDTNAVNFENNSNHVYVLSDEEQSVSLNPSDDDEAMQELPSEINKRSAPQDQDSSSVGLEKKRKTVLPTRYIMKPKTTQLHYVISLMCKDSVDVSQESIKEKTLKISPEDLLDEFPDALLDPSLEFDKLQIQEYVSEETWDLIQTKLNEKQEKSDWRCKSCSELLDNEPSIVCESCLFWFHLVCTRLKNIQAVKSWFCDGCCASITE